MTNKATFEIGETVTVRSDITNHGYSYGESVIIKNKLPDDYFVVENSQKQVRFIKRCEMRKQREK